MNCSTPGLPVHHQLPEFTQTHVHRVGGAIQSSHPLSSPSPPASNPSQHQSLLHCKEIQSVHPKGDQTWAFIGRTDDEAETPILWPPDVKNRLLGKDPDAGKDWRQEEKGMTEDEMVGWHHRLNGHEFEQALGVGDGQGSLVYCSSWGRKVSDMTE